MWKCLQCGANNGDARDDCWNCSTIKVTDQEGPKQTQSDEELQSPELEASEPKKKIGTVVTLSLLGVAIAASALWFFVIEPNRLETRILGTWKFPSGTEYYVFKEDGKVDLVLSPCPSDQGSLEYRVLDNRTIELGRNKTTQYDVSIMDDRLIIKTKGEDDKSEYIRVDAVSWPKPPAKYRGQIEGTCFLIKLLSGTENNYTDMMLREFVVALYQGDEARIAEAASEVNLQWAGWSVTQMGQPSRELDLFLLEWIPINNSVADESGKILFVPNQP